MNIEEAFAKVERYTSKWEQYYELYEKYFQKFQDKSPVVVEVGVCNGGSLEAWKNYFGEGATIVGVDNRLKVTHIDGCQLIRGDQGDASFWDNFIAGCPNIDVFIDDGSHFSEHQNLTFMKVFPIMKDGGVYFVEDTHASYMSTFNGAPRKQGTFIEEMKTYIDVLHMDHFDQSWRGNQWANEVATVKSLHFYDSVVVIEKGFRPKYNVTYHNREKWIG